jgi:hypothetical protein
MRVSEHGGIPGRGLAIVGAAPAYFTRLVPWYFAEIQVDVEPQRSTLCPQPFRSGRTAMPEKPPQSA